MIRSDGYDAWLDPELTDPHEVRTLLAPPPPRLLELRPVSAAVGNIRNNGPLLVEARLASGS